MKYELPVIQANGQVVTHRLHLIEKLHREANTGQVRVNRYYGVYGSEAFYTLTNGAVLHEVNAIGEDGRPYRTIALVCVEPQASLWQRFAQSLRPLGWLQSSR